MPHPIIIDCDPGADDAIALFLAFAHPAELEILGITTVAGNVPLALTQANARRICDLAGQHSMRVYAGCPRPLVRSLITAEEVHGKTGLDGLSLPDPVLALQSPHAVDFLIETLMDSAGGITLATLGPLTNVAMALVKQPQIRDRIQEIVCMGGAITQGNITPSAEFNVYVDPHAAHVVFTAGIPLTLISLDVTHQALVLPARRAQLREIGSPTSQATVDLLDHYGRHDMDRYGLPGPPLHDPCVIAYLLHPELFRGEFRYVEVETNQTAGLGRTIVDRWGSTGKPANVNVITQIDADGFYALLVKALTPE
jgi:purine nucleosidase